ncbi:MAG: nucleoside deaminase [Clostridia bacterium]|nr:nucleoside deaminase [Clostridia bacterium]
MQNDQTAREDLVWMKRALSLAREAGRRDEIAVGCVIVKEGTVLAEAFNEREARRDPTAHAEVTAVRRAAEKTGDRYLTGCTLYVTLEPCPMCAGLLAQLRLKRLVFGAWDEKAGCAGSYYDLVGDGAFGPVLPVTGGILREECASVLRDSLQKVRDKEKKE